MSTYSVYIHENLINGKKYIGITSQKPSYRWGKNGSNYKFQSKFFNAIKKYGWDNFSHKVLYSGLEISAAVKYETELIELYNSIDNGYNISTGGALGFKKGVLCITTGEFFESVTEASKAINRTSSSLSHCLHGDQNTCGEKDGIKLEWRFVIESYNEDKNKKEQIKVEKEKDKKELAHKITEEFTKNKKTVTQIAKEYQMAKETVSNILKREGVEVLPSSQAKRIAVSMYSKNWEYEQDFESITAALKFLNKTDSEISRLKKACQEEWRIYMGHHWKIKES